MKCSYNFRLSLVLTVCSLLLGMSLETAQAADNQEVPTKYLRKVLPNGLTAIIKHNPDSRVFAIDVLGRSRAAWEKPGQEGLTDFVNRMLVKGTAQKNAEQVQAALDNIGAKLQTNDSPYIPYDDRYTWRAFSFMRFETIDEYAQDGVKILCEMIAEPSFPEDEIEKTRGQVMGIIGMESGSTYKSCSDLYHSKLFENHPFARPVIGTRRSVGTFTRDDLITYHREYYSPGNMIMAVVSNLEPDTVMQWLESSFGRMPAGPVQAVSIPLVQKASGIVEATQPMDKEQVYLYLGNIVPGLTSEAAPALELAVEILSNRLQLNLREKQGLAYSVGAGVRLLGEFGWYTCIIGTGYGNFETAKSGMLREIESLKTGTPEQAELDKARNSLWGSMLMRNMSCINQAFNMAYYEFVGVGYNYDDGLKDRLDKVTVTDVQNAARMYLDTDNYVMAYVGKVAK